MLLARIYKKIKAVSCHRTFVKNSVYGKKLQTDAYSLCRNTTGSKESIRIGDNCRIRCQLIALGSGKISIGNNTYIGGPSKVGATESITIGNDVIISGDVHIFDNNNHPTAPEARLAMTQSADSEGPLWSWIESESKPVVIEDNVWIGERCTVLKGVKIGRGSIVACNSVVTNDVPPYTIVAGNPAKVVKNLLEDRSNNEK